MRESTPLLDEKVKEVEYEDVSEDEEEQKQAVHPKRRRVSSSSSSSDSSGLTVKSVKKKKHSPVKIELILAASEEGNPPKKLRFSLTDRAHNMPCKKISVFDMTMFGNCLFTLEGKPVVSFIDGQIANFT